jgi:hypothetical protein
VKKAILIIILFSSFLLNAQSDKTLPRVSVRGTVTIPRNVSSGAFRASFLGLYDAGLNFNVRLFGNFTVGLGYNSSMFNCSQIFKNIGLSTRLQVHDGVFRIGFDKFRSDTRFLSVGLCTGYSYNQYTSVAAPHDSLNGRYPSFFSGFFVRPEISINFLVEDNFAFGATLAYNYRMYYYDPAYNAFDQYGDYDRNQHTYKINTVTYKNKSPIGWLSFGFCFYYGFKKKSAGS